MHVAAKKLSLNNTLYSLKTIKDFYYIFGVIIISSLGCISLIKHDIFINFFVFAKWFIICIYSIMNINYVKKLFSFIFILIVLAFTLFLIYTEILIFDSVNLFVSENQTLDLNVLYVLIFTSMVTGIIILASVNGAQEAQAGQRMKSALRMAGAGLLLMAVFALPFWLAATYLID